jgi:nickel superoxide dismutase
MGAMNLREWIFPSRTVEAHCDLPCGIYDPEQARIEAESCLKIDEKYADSKDEVYRARAILIKEQRAELAKHHLDVLWSDWYKPEKHDAKFPQLKEVLKQAVAQGSKVKASMDKAEAQKLLDLIDQVDQIWQKAGGPQETRVARPAAAPTRA